MSRREMLERRKKENAQDMHSKFRRGGDRGGYSAGTTTSGGAGASRAPSSGWVITSAFEAGNIECVSAEGSDVQVRIRKDAFTELEQQEHSQWFYFRAALPQPRPDGAVTYSVVNGGDVSYPTAWPGLTVATSQDRKVWTRTPAAYDHGTGVLSWTHTATADAVYFAFFEPYSLERCAEYVAACAADPATHVATLGASPAGRPIDCVTLGSGALHAWVIARQHPGEPQGAFYAEGLLDRLRRRGDDAARRAAALFTWHVVPCMCPDGVALGHLRTNSVGANLNREWWPTKNAKLVDGHPMKQEGGDDYAAPTLERSPEVLCVLRAMEATGVDLFVDAHGDEEMPYVFIAGMEGVPGWGPRLQALQGAFSSAYCRANGDVQTKYSYEPDAPGQGNLAVCSNSIAHRFDCLSVTLEMPYKETPLSPDPTFGFTSEQCQRVGAALLDAAVYVAPFLRADRVPEFAAEDAYVCPIECGPLGDPDNNPTADW